MGGTNQLPEQKSSDFLKSHSDIPSEALWFLNKLEKTNWWEEQADLFKKNEKLVSNMEKILSSKVDAIVSKGEQIDDNDAKILIAYDALKDRSLGRTIPNNPEERKIVALRIAEDIQLLQWFEAHAQTNRYYDFVNKSYTNTPNENTLDLNIDAISFDSWNPAVNNFLSRNNILKNRFLNNKKHNHLSTISRCTYTEDQSSPDFLLHKQVSAKQNDMYRSEQTQREDFTLDVDKCVELTDIFIKNMDAFNNPQNEDMVKVKDFFMSFVCDAYPNRKSASWLYNGWNDLSRDDGFKGGWNGEKIRKDPGKIENNTIQLFVDGKNVYIQNTITKESIPLDKNTFNTWAMNRNKKEQNNKAIQDYRTAFEQKYMQEYKLTQNIINDMTQDERLSIYKEFQTKMLIDVFTNNEKAFNAILSEEESDQIGARQLYDNGSVFNSIIETINKWPIPWFDCTVWNTTMEVKNINWEKYLELVQGKSVVQLWFNAILWKSIDQRSPEEKQKDEIKKQEELAAIPDTDINSYEPSHRIPDLRRALYAIDNPRESRGINYIELNNLNLSDKDVAFLSKKIDVTDGNYALNLDHNAIEHVPKSIFSIKWITAIDLDHNNLEALPKVEAASHITSLHIAWNSFDYLPDLRQFSNLQSLNISSNNITNIDDVAQIRNLTHFTADRTWISKIPVDLTQKTTLQTLSLSNNKLTEKLDVSQLTNLESLHLDGNKDMADFPIVGINSKIRYIDCSYTSIKSIPKNIKKECPNIEKINIYSNILSGKQMIDQFLTGNLTNKWYTFNKDWEMMNIKNLKDFFVWDNKFTYTEHSSDSLSNWLEKAKKSLWLMQLDNIPYAARKLPSGKVNIIVFAPVEIHNGWLSS